MNDKVSLKSKAESKSNIIRLFLGDKRPDIFTRLAFQMAFFTSVTLFMWSLTSWFSLTFGWKVAEDKVVQIVELIENRAAVYGMRRIEFQQRLTNLHLVSMIAWFLSFLSTILLYRKKRIFIIFMLVSHGLYIGSLLYLLGIDFFLNDIGWFEKLTLLVAHTSSWICWIMHQKERQGQSILDTTESVST